MKEATGSARGAFTFIYCNVFEEISLIDLPGIPTVVATDLPRIIIQVEEQEQSGSIPQDHEGFFGASIMLRIPKANRAINLCQPIFQGNLWLVSSNCASIYPLGDHRGGRVGDSLIFGKSESLYLQPLENVVERDRLVIETADGWCYHYRVKKRMVLNRSDQYLISDSELSKLIILKELSGSEKVLVIEASFLSLDELLDQGVN